MPKNFIKAVSTFVADRTPGRINARVPVAVRQLLGARAGDGLVWEEGCEAAVTRAALKGPYFVVRLEPGASAPSPCPTPTPAESMERFGTALESMADAVRRKQRGE